MEVKRTKVRFDMRFPLAAESASYAEEPYPTTSALRSTQRQSPNLGLLSKEASLTLRMYEENNSQRGECKEKSYEEGLVPVDCEADGLANPGVSIRPPPH